MILQSYLVGEPFHLVLGMFLIYILKTTGYSLFHCVVGMLWASNGWGWFNAISHLPSGGSPVTAGISYLGIEILGFIL
ncbi:hypothetical protein HanIR_Chr01g0040831 [Helianthus annuus]|nr:hypothetical protein HanIR_Chr01g0040831 [Helianthus annuus]